MENIIDVHYNHPKRVWKDLKIKNLGGYHDLYAKSFMLLEVEISITGGICYAVHQHTTANNKSMKNVTKTKNHHILCTEMQTIYADGQCLKNLPVDNFEWDKTYQILMKSS